MSGALGWGTVAASSLVIGALAALVHSWSDRVVGSVLAFGAGALISAVSFELAQEGAKAGSNAAVGIGLAVGAVTYYVLDKRVERMGTKKPEVGGQREGGSDAGPALALGAFLDGIPEQAVLGLGLAGGEKVSVGLLAAIFVSNLPEAIGSSSAMLESGHTRRNVLRLWSAVALVCALATIGGYALADSAGGDLEAAIDGFAAGALLVMLVDSMIPESVRRTGRRAGLITALGFALAAGLSAAS
jgi:zinc transporter, ZIP family